jgi:hypothetical protein
VARRKPSRGRRPAYHGTVPTSARDKLTLGRLLLQPNVWTVGAILALIGFPALRDATADPMRRNHYFSEADCRCDYGDRCTLDRGRWAGPWYARDVANRRFDDPGAGQCRSQSHGSSASRYWSSSAVDRPLESYHGPVAIEAGYRGGFGGTGRVRAAGS